MTKENHRRMDIDDNVAVQHEKNLIKNARKGKEMCNIWLTKEEVADLKIIFKDMAETKDKTFWAKSLGLLLIEVQKRGDITLN